MDEQKEGGLALGTICLMLASFMVFQDKSGLHPDVTNPNAIFGKCADCVSMTWIIFSSCSVNKHSM